MAPNPNFASTHWSVIIAANADDPQASRAALETLCATYWFPIYAFIRRQGHQDAAAQDLTQGFFAAMLERDDFARLTPDRGRFRSFLLVAVKNFLCNEHDKAMALKRGGDWKKLSLDFADAERKYSAQHPDEDAERMFGRQWALEILQQAQTALKQEYQQLGKLELFDHLQVFLAGEHSETQREIGERLGMSASAIKSAVFRMKGQLGDCLRDEVRKTVDSDQEVEDEIAALFKALGGN